MKTPQHTPELVPAPAPWHMSSNPEIPELIFCGDDHGTVAAMNDSRPDWRKSRDMILAAPEMYRALLGCKWLLETLVKMDRIPANSEALRDTLSAIAKAEGTVSK